MSDTRVPKFGCRVSSTLNNDVKNYGKQHMFDNNEESCWNSDQGSPQWIEILLEETRPVRGLVFQFQGGFVGSMCVLELYKDQPVHGSLPDAIFDDFYPEDVNQPQTYTLKQPENARFIRIIFNGSSDFYGRIVVYRLTVF